MIEKPTSRERYNRAKAVKGLREAFDTTSFGSDEERDILFDSYMINIDTLVTYACTKQISPYKYAREIKNVLVARNTGKHR